MEIKLSEELSGSRMAEAKTPLRPKPRAERKHLEKQTAADRPAGSNLRIRKLIFDSENWLWRFYDARTRRVAESLDENKYPK
jgi:hypothetical protein